MSESVSELENRVLLLAPTPRDAVFSQKLFSDCNIRTQICRSIPEICEELARGAAMLVLAAETFNFDDFISLSTLLKNQPPWSDLPILLLVSPTSNGLQFTQQLRDLHSVTYIKRPIEVVALLTAVQSGLRDRQRQYAVREHLVERERQSQALLDADRRKDEFLATLAHELRNPLSPLRSGVDLLRLEEDDNADRRAVLEMMDRQLHQMVRLVDDLLDVSRITRDKLTLATDRVDIRTVVFASIETTQQMIDSAHIALKTNIPAEPIYVQGDATRLTQVVSNLLNNAVKYSEEASPIELTVESVDDFAVVSVKDFGVGIPPEMLGKIFEIFTQVDASLTRARGGLGIGLTLVRRIVEMHGGTVTAMSNGKGQGSLFQVRLPCAAGDAPESNHSETHDHEPYASKRVLIVDDTRAARRMLGQLLVKLGHEVFEAESGLEAIQQVEAVQPDVVISDIGMPGMDGYELARRVRSLKCIHSPYLVALTGYGQDSDRSQAIAAGFDCHLIKPVSYSMLQRTLSHCCASTNGKSSH